MATLDYKSSLVRYRRYLQASQKHPLWKASLYLILSLALVIILVVAALRPTLITIATLVGDIKQQREISSRLNEKISAISRAQQELAAVTSRLVYLDQALPVEIMVGQWNQTVSSIASQSGVTVTAVLVNNIVVSKSASAESEMTFSLTAVGAFDQLKQFLQVFEGTRRLVKIEEVQFSRATLDSTQLDLTISGLLGNFQ